MSQVTESQTELHPEPEPEPIRPVFEFEVCVRIKKASKYYHQGLVDPTNSKSKQRFFKLESFDAFSAIHPEHGFKVPPCESVAYTNGAYVIHFNGNSYRVQDCEFFLRSTKNNKHFIRIV